MHDTMHNSPMVGAGHHVREKTQNPIIGILTQPVQREGKWSEEFLRVQNKVWQDRQDMAIFSENVIDPFPGKQFVEASAVKFLESAGARVVPVNFNQDEEKMKNQLKQLNGLYIPGNSQTLVSHGDYPFTKAVQKILRWS